MITWVFLGGACGALMRWGLTAFEAVTYRNHQRPVDGRGTTAANTIACIILGWLISSHVSEGVNALLVAGVCGGLSTFSSFALELVGMLNDRRYKRMVEHLVANIGFGIAGFYLAWMLAG